VLRRTLVLDECRTNGTIQAVHAIQSNRKDLPWLKLERTLQAS